MKGMHYVTVVYGSDQIRKIQNEKALTEEEIEGYVKTYSFKTKEELKAFILGIEEAQGWMDVMYFEGIKLHKSKSNLLQPPSVNSLALKMAK